MFTNKCFSTLFIFVISCLFSASLWAQITMEDVIYLKNGSILRGQLLEYTPNASIKIKIEGGSILIYDSSEVLKIEKEEYTKFPKDQPNTTTLNEIERPAIKKDVKKHSQHIPEPGFCGMLAVGNVVPTFSSYGALMPGINLDATVGYRFHHLFSIGAGAGILLDFSQSFVYGFASIRGDILNKSFSPYYEINVGYGLPLSKNRLMLAGMSEEITEMRGGLYFRPSIGMRFGSRNRVHSYIDIGMHYQAATYAGRTWNNFSYVEKHISMRPSIRVGMLF